MPITSITPCNEGRDVDGVDVDEVDVTCVAKEEVKDDSEDGLNAAIGAEAAKDDVA